jgi:Tol biopolymer transport system component
VVVAALVGLSAACSDPAVPGPATQPEAGGKEVPPATNRIAFVHAPNADGTLTSQIYTANPDGSDVRQITHGASGARGPKWSPDGALIAFSRGAAMSINTARADGTSETQLVSGAPVAFWLSDRTVVYMCGLGNLVRLCAVDVDATNQRTLLSYTTPAGVVDAGHALSPDGATFVLMRTAGVDPADPFSGGPTRIYLMTRDGSNARRLTSTVPFDAESDPTWSPDGKRIAFYSLMYGIAVVNVDGSNLHSASRDGQLLTSKPPTTGIGPAAWSPDATRLVYGPSSGRSFFVANADGTGPIDRIDLNIPTGGAEATPPAWSWTSR